jgi:hypothetical protein
MARAKVMKAHPYGIGPDSLHTEDYELFTRMHEAGIAFLNLREPLMTIRVRPGGVSQANEQLQVSNFILCARRHLERTVAMRPDPSVMRVLVNRIDRDVTYRDLREGLRALERVEAMFLDRDPDPDTDEIQRIADEQRVDILVQTMLKAAPAGRLAAVYMALRSGRRLVSPSARRYLWAKIRRG